jgi:hypothetical protein
MNKDGIYNILLHLDSDDLKNVCTTNKVFAEICSLQQFWKDKLDREEIMILPGYYLSAESYNIFKDLKNKAGGILKILYGNFDHVPHHILPKKILDKIDREDQYGYWDVRVRSIGNKIIMNTDKYDIALGSSLTKDELMYFLMLYYDYLRITDIISKRKQEDSSSEYYSEYSEEY